MSDMESVATLMESTSLKIQQLQQAFAELESQSAVTMNFKWKQLEDHFRGLEQSLKKKFDELKKQEKEFQETVAKSEKMLEQQEAVVVAKELTSLERLQEKRDAALAMIFGKSKLSLNTNYTAKLAIGSPPSNLRTTMAPAVMASSATTVAPFQGLKSTAGLPVSRRSGSAGLSSVSNGGRIRCMQVWPIEGIKKFETLSYLPPLSTEALLKQVDYLIRSKWVPCLEFSKVGFVFREHNSSPGYYDGRYWTMWKLPMFGCTDATQVLNEVEEVKKEYPDAYVRIIGFDNLRQVQCVSFIAFRPPGCEESGKA